MLCKPMPSPCSSVRSAPLFSSPSLARARFGLSFRLQSVVQKRAASSQEDKWVHASGIVAAAAHTLEGWRQLGVHKGMKQRREGRGEAESFGEERDALSRGVTSSVLHRDQTPGTHADTVGWVQ